MRKPNNTFLLKNAAIKWPQMTFCYTPRSFHCSTIIREVSFCRKWEQVQKSTARNLITLNRKYEVSTKSPNSWFRKTYQKGDRKSIRDIGDLGKETCSKHNRTRSLMNSETETVCTQPVYLCTRWGSKDWKRSG